MEINGTAMLTGVLTFFATALTAWFGLRAKASEQETSSQIRFYADLTVRVKHLEDYINERDKQIQKLAHELSREKARTTALVMMMKSNGVTIPSGVFDDDEEEDEDDDV